ncbi:hypothetical protein FGB62_21g26 [Gracilaria domingensis]|nr:hypothetical protein FGB62_21g26 [Gracilaria domingensis]
MGWPCRSMNDVWFLVIRMKNANRIDHDMELVKLSVQSSGGGNGDMSRGDSDVGGMVGDFGGKGGDSGDGGGGEGVAAAFIGGNDGADRSGGGGGDRGNGRSNPMKLLCGYGGDRGMGGIDGDGGDDDGSENPLLYLVVDTTLAEAGSGNHSATVEDCDGPHQQLDSAARGRRQVRRLDLCVDQRAEDWKGRTEVRDVVMPPGHLVRQTRHVARRGRSHGRRGRRRCRLPNEERAAAAEAAAVGARWGRQWRARGGASEGGRRAAARARRQG